MTQKFSLILFLCVALHGFANDLVPQFLLIKELLPQSSRVGILFNPRVSGINDQILNAASAAGLQAVKAPIKSIREVSGAIRSLSQYKVDFIYLHEDKVISGATAIKFVVKQTVKKKVPVFSSAHTVFSGGAFGRLVKSGEGWQLHINGKVKNLFPIAIPENTKKFVIKD